MLLGIRYRVALGVVCVPRGWCLLSFKIPGPEKLPRGKATTCQLYWQPLHKCDKSIKPFQRHWNVVIVCLGGCKSPKLFSRRRSWWNKWWKWFTFPLKCLFIKIEIFCLISTYYFRQCNDKKMVEITLVVFLLKMSNTFIRLKITICKTNDREVSFYPVYINFSLIAQMWSTNIIDKF